MIVVEQRREIQKTASVRLADLTTFAWEKIYIFSPYTSLEKIHQFLGFKWSVARSTGIDYRDDINLLVFVENGKVVHFIEYPRTRADFKPLENSQGLTPERAKFEIQTKNRDVPLLVLY